MRSIKRDKTCSIKVNSKLLEQFQAIVDRDTRCYRFNNKINYDCLFSKRGIGKYTLADFVEEALKEFIEKN